MAQPTTSLARPPWYRRADNWVLGAAAAASSVFFWLVPGLPQPKKIDLGLVVGVALIGFMTRGVYRSYMQEHSVLAAVLAAVGFLVVFDGAFYWYLATQAH